MLASARLKTIGLFLIVLTALNAAPVLGSAPGRQLMADDGHVLGFFTDRLVMATRDHVVTVAFVGARPVTPSADSSAGDINRQPIEKVKYSSLWPDVDLIYEKTPRGVIKSTYMVSPGADPGVIRLRFNQAVMINDQGELVVRFPSGEWVEAPPVAWEERNGKRLPVSAVYRRISDQEIGFAVNGWDRRNRLVIDPVGIWNTFLGSTNYDTGTGVAVDANGDVYVTGTSLQSWDDPVLPFPIPPTVNANAFAAKLYGDGGYPIWHTFLGSTNMDYGNGIALDGTGNVYVTGTSFATWGSNPTRAYSGGNDAFVAKLDAETGALIKHTFLGASGTLQDTGQGIAARNGKVYVTGQSMGSWLNAPEPRRGYTGAGDAFAARLDGANLALEWYTFFGSYNYADDGQGIAADTSGNVVVVGTSPGSWGSPRRAHSSTGTSRDAFVAKLNSSGDLLWNTFLGSGGQYYGQAIAVDNGGSVFVAGHGDGEWTEQPIHSHSGDVDAFVAKLDGSGYYQWHTFLGSADYDQALGMALTGGGDILVTGVSGTGWGNPINAFNVGASDAFAAKLKGNGDRIWNTFIGGSGYDNGKSLAVDGNQNVYVVGHSNQSWENPVRIFMGDYDAFTVKLSYRTISGKVTAVGVPLGGVTISISGVGTTETDDNGEYQFTVTQGWSGTVTPGLSGYSFLPNSRTYSNVTADWPNQDFSTSGTLVTISGYIKEDPQTPVAGVTVTADAVVTTFSTITNSEGFYQLSVNSTWNVTITPSLEGYTFVPISRNYSPVGSSNRTDQNFTATWTVYIEGSVTKDGVGLAGVTLNGLPGNPTPTTGPGGAYSIRVRYNWSGTVTPAMDHKVFNSTDPPMGGSRTYINVISTLADQNYLGYQAWYVSGRITETGGAPVSEVSLTDSNGGSTTTDSQGYYTLSIKENLSGTVTPVKLGYSFTPGNLSYSNINSDKSQDFNAGWNVYISGSIKDGSNQGIPGVVLNGFPENPTPQTDANGNYLARVGFSWSGTVIPALSHYLFDPSVITFNNLTGPQSQNFTAIPAVYISGSIRESDGTIVKGATLTVDTDEATFTTKTDETGQYLITVKKGLSVTVTPSFVGYTFTPPSQTFPSISTDHSLNFNANWLIYISGSIARTDGSGVAGVKLNGLPGDPLTGTDGSYRVRLGYDASGTVTPTLLGYQFSPVSHSFTHAIDAVTEKHFTAYAVPTHTIAGYARERGAPLSGVALTAGPGESTVTDGHGRYQFSFNQGWSGTITPEAAYAFTPLSRTYTNLAQDYTAQDFQVGGPMVFLPLIIKAP